MTFNFNRQQVVTFFKRTIAAQLHLLGCVAAFVGLLVLLQHIRPTAEAFHFWSCFVFGITGIFVFGVSTVYHFMSDGFRISKKLEQQMEDLDHVAIYLFIAGTYTPFIVNAISVPLNHVLLWLIWSLALGGITYTYARPKLPLWAQHRFVNTGIFLGMGWVFVGCIGEAIRHMSGRGILFLIAGGITYTVGAVIYALKKPNLWKGIFGFHELWHLMVLIGFGFHYLMILDFYS